MPNIVRHRVAVSGVPDRVADFRLRMFGGTANGGSKGQGPVFDFGALVPMPDVVRGTGGSSLVTDGLIILGEDAIPEQFGKTAGEQVVLMLDYPWVKDAGVVDRAGLVDLLRRRAREAGTLDESLDGAHRAVRVYRATGHASQQGWALEHWGVNGGAYDCEISNDEPGLLEFAFSTSWSTPEPIWDRLAEAFPDLVVDVSGFEEAWHFAIEGEIRSGQNGVKEVEPTRELYERVFGKLYEDEEDDGETPPAMSEEEARAHPSATIPKPAPLREEEKGWRRYKWDLFGWLIGAIILLIYFTW